MSEWNANYWSSAARSLLWWNISRGCNDATSASSGLKNFIVPKCPRLAVGHIQSVVARIARLADAKTQLERRFVHVGAGYASRDERSLVWRGIDTAFEIRILTGAVVNVDYIKPRRFLEDAREIVLERVRDAVERHGSAKVNTAFNTASL